MREPPGIRNYGNMHFAPDRLEREGYKTAIESKGKSTGVSKGLEFVRQEKHRGSARQDYKTPHHRAKFRSDANLKRGMTHDRDTYWGCNREPGTRGHPVSDSRVHGEAHFSKQNEAQIALRHELAREKEIWLKKHGHHGFWGMRQDEVDVPTELKKTEPQQRWEDARMRERTAAADTVPVDDYDGQPKASGYVPTPVDKAVHPDDYALSDPQLEFEISKAMKSNDEERLAALKIVRALRDPPKQPVKKKPYNKGMMAVASDWMEDF